MEKQKIREFQSLVDNAMLQADVITFKPLDIERVAQKIGFAIKKIKFINLPDKIMGLMICNNMSNDLKEKIGSDKLILLNNMYDEKHQRFVIAHELGHYFLHKEVCQSTQNLVPAQIFAQIEDDEKGIEGEACRFAAMMLMDKKTFVEAYNELKKCKVNNKMDIIRNLSQQFNVPQMAVKRRICELDLN